MENYDWYDDVNQIEFQWNTRGEIRVGRKCSCILPKTLPFLWLIHSTIESCFKRIFFYTRAWYGKSRATCLIQSISIWLNFSVGNRGEMIKLPMSPPWIKPRVFYSFQYWANLDEFWWFYTRAWYGKFWRISFWWFILIWLNWLRIIAIFGAISVSAYRFLWP